MYSTKIEKNMEGFINSDLKMVASKTFDDILDKIKNSNLNFHLQLSPFSAVISLKKSLVCDKLGLPFLVNSSSHVPEHKALLESNQQLEAELISFKSKYDSLAQEFNSACTTINNLEKHIVNYQKAAQSETQNQVIINELKTKVAQLDESLKKKKS